VKIKHLILGASLLGAPACGGEDDTGPLGTVDSLLVVQRPARNDMGDIFQYTSYIPRTASGAGAEYGACLTAGDCARLVKLSPPTADGTLETVFPSQQLLASADGAMFQDVDISSYDISFDANEIVISARTSVTSHYGLYVLTLSTGQVDVIPTDPGRDYISPIWLPGNKIMFTTNSAVEEIDGLGGAITPRQHVDEYERGTTLQVGRINRDGTAEELGPRNLSHRTFPTLVSDGRIMLTQWDHLGPMNAGHLMYMNPDFTDLREAFGKEGKGASNSTLKAREVSPGRFVAIATSRDRTIQAGAMIDIRLGTVATDEDGNVSAADQQTESRSTYHLLTPDVPRDRTPSAETIGRYYDAFPLNAKDKPDILVSWADGPVESGVLGAAGLSANFGVYLYDSARNTRLPILDDGEMWDIFARPLQGRTAPPVIASAIDNELGDAALIGSLNAYDTTIAQFTPGQIYGVRVMEGFSSEEGFPEMFGTTMFEGQANLGVAPLANDGSWLAKVPANVPLHVQAVDKFGMSIQNEPVWFSARKGESRVCGGCHEDRGLTTTVNPGQLQAFSIGAFDAQSTRAREARVSAALGRDQVTGVAWDVALQPVFNNNCISCHSDTSPAIAGLEGYTITDPVTGDFVTVPFDLTGRMLTLQSGSIDLGTWPASYITMAGPDMEAIEEGNLVISGNFKVYMNPQDSRGSAVIQKLNPVTQFPTQNATRAFAGTGHMAEQNLPDITADEHYLFILAADMGVNFYARENNPGLDVY
jgi:hypothetical protein